MKKKILLPENIEDITLGQYQRLDALQKRDLDVLAYNKRVIEIFTDLKFRDVEKIAHKDYEDIIKQITSALNQDVEFKDRFFINDTEFGFITNFDEITTAEYVDLSNHGLDVENLHKVMAVLFRPITNKDAFGNYEIESYEGTKEYQDVMKYTPLNIVNGAIVFFCNLSSELKNYIQKSTQEVQARETKRKATFPNGDGMQQ